MSGLKAEVSPSVIPHAAPRPAEDTLSLLSFFIVKKWPLDTKVFKLFHFRKRLLWRLFVGISAKANCKLLMPPKTECEHFGHLNDYLR